MTKSSEESLASTPEQDSGADFLRDNGDGADTLGLSWAELSSDLDNLRDGAVGRSPVLRAWHPGIKKKRCYVSK